MFSRLQKVRDPVKNKPALQWILKFLDTLLIIGFGFVAGYGLNVDNIQDDCNQHIIDNYFTEEIQYCYQKVFNTTPSLPFEVSIPNIPNISSQNGDIIIP